MDISYLESSLNFRAIGKQLYELISELYPICRSITGDGVRQTLAVIKKNIPKLEIHEVPTGREVFDWTVPKEWNIKDAYIKNSKGERIVDFKNSNLHVLNYSIPVNRKIKFGELKEHLFTLPEYPDRIPYRTSYFKENWGFCLSHNQFLGLKEEEYEVCIDSSLESGYLSYGEYYIRGKRPEEVLISCHVCHPSLCNDNLSGIVITCFLAELLSDVSLNYSYRFLFIPGTIGSITWLSLNEKKVANIKHGLVAACLGDPGSFTYKKSRIGNSEIDKVVINVLRHYKDNYKVIDFTPYGYDERQYCSPGFNLPIGCLMRSSYGSYPEYHTSADNLEFIKSEYLADSLLIYIAVFNVLENNKKYLNANPKCEPQLGKRGLYAATGGKSNTIADQMALLWVLNMSDGKHTLLDISDRSGIEFKRIQHAADVLLQNNLLYECVD